MKKKVATKTKSSSAKSKKKPATTAKKKLVTTAKKKKSVTAKKNPTRAKRSPIKESELSERIRVKAFEIYCSRDPYSDDNVGDWGCCGRG